MDNPPPSHARFRYFDLVMAAFVVVMLFAVPARVRRHTATNPYVAD